MTRMLPTLVALLASPAALLVPTVPAAHADFGVYAQITTISFRDTRDAPAGRDLSYAYVDIDPNLSELEVEATFRRETFKPSFLVLRLGDVVSGTCQLRLEVVSNRWDDEVALRQPGESTLPPVAARGRAHESYIIEDDPHLDDLVPTCAVMELRDTEGTVLDSAVGNVSNSSVPRAFLRVSSEPDEIRNVDSGSEQVLGYRLATAGGIVYDAALDAVPGDSGLTVDPTHVDLGDIGEQADRWSTSRTLRMTAMPGLHTLTLRSTGGNAAASETTVRIWGRGGTLAGDDSLAGKTFFAEQDDSAASDGQWREWTARAFLDDTWVRLSHRDTDGNAPSSYQPCTEVTTTCQRYEYDAETALVQIGTDLGELRDGALVFHGEEYRAALAAGAGTTVAFEGNNLFDPDKDTAVNRAYFGLTLRKDGTFTRVTRIGAVGDVTQRGRYRIAQDGTLVARTIKGKVVRTGLAFVLDDEGDPRPNELGVYAFDVWFHARKG